VVTKTLSPFKHTSIGAKTHKARTATAHVSYIMRSDAMTQFQAGNMPDGSRGTRVFFDKLWEKAGMPDNARIADKLMIALPLELTQEQRYDAVRSFMNELGKGRIAWCAAHHDSGKDAHNPHVHIIFKDADIDTGRKVVGTTTSSRDVREAKENDWKIPPRMTTRDLRHAWCDHLNRVMEREGLDIRFDARTYKDRGIDKKSGIHIGPKAQALAEKGYGFKSHDKERGEQIGRQTIHYSEFDQGSRVQHEREERERSMRLHPAAREDREKRQLREEQARSRQDMYQEQQRDRDALRKLHESQNRAHQEWAKQLYAEARHAAYRQVKDQYAARWEEARSIGDHREREKAAADLKREEKKTYEQEAAKQVNERRPEKDKAWKELKATQDKARDDLRALHRQETAALARQQIAERLGMHEKWRAHELQKQANRIDARLTVRQGMAAQQMAAVKQARLHVREKNSVAAGAVAIPTNLREAAAAHYKTARLEQARHEALRDKLDKLRTENLARAGLAPERRANVPANGKHGRSQAPGGAGAARRQIIAPGIHAARGNRFSQLQQHARRADPQSQIRAAAEAGHALTGDARANAPADVRERLDANGRKAMDVRNFGTGGSERDQRGKGRQGGGRGR
jgi:MobA/MobL family